MNIYHSKRGCYNSNNELESLIWYTKIVQNFQILPKLENNNLQQINLKELNFSHLIPFTPKAFQEKKNILCGNFSHLVKQKTNCTLDRTASSFT